MAKSEAMNDCDDCGFRMCDACQSEECQTGPAVEAARVWLAHFEGGFLGATAVIFAPDEAEARRLLTAHIKEDARFSDAAKVYDIEEVARDGVLITDTGDY